MWATLTSKTKTIITKCDLNCETRPVLHALFFPPPTSIVMWCYQIKFSYKTRRQPPTIQAIIDDGNIHIYYIYMFLYTTIMLVHVLLYRVQQSVLSYPVPFFLLLSLAIHKCSSDKQKIIYTMGSAVVVGDGGDGGDGKCWYFGWCCFNRILATDEGWVGI